MKQEDQQEKEQELAGGNVAARVVRVGSTVRKPVTASTASVEAFLQHLAESGFLHAPRSLGRDAQGRQVLEYIEGETISHPEMLTVDLLKQVAGIIRELHRVSSTFPQSLAHGWTVAIQPNVEDLICHNDLGPWNLVRGQHKDTFRWVFIDWDGAGPSSRLWDLAYAAQSFVPLAHVAPGGNPEQDALRLRAFVDGYGPEAQERMRFPELLSRRTRASYELLAEGARKGIEPWARIYRSHQGEYWRRAAEYVREHEQVWLSALFS